VATSEGDAAVGTESAASHAALFPGCVGELHFAGFRHRVPEH
jgi:hypothetical protein